MFSYTIQPGDNLWELAQRYHTTIEEITAYNPGLTPYNLYAGLKISIPLLQVQGLSPNPYTLRKNKCSKGCVSKTALELKTAMRLLWDQDGYYQHNL